MKLAMLIGGFLLGAATVLVAGAAMSQEGKSVKSGNGAADTHAQQPSPQEMEAMMKAWVEAMSPGEPHKHLQKSVGNWDNVTRIWMAGPNMPPTETKGTSETTSLLDGRFILQKNHSQMPMPDMKTGEMKMIPWEGIGMFGYDNYQKMYVGCWVDNMGTQMLTMKGNLSQDGKTMTMYGEMDEPMLGVLGRYVKYVTRIIDDNKEVFEIYDLHAGDDYKVVEVEYTRKK